eukprot:scaffold178623_cov21-Tisochrysis_lutea.AAC.3
MPAPAAAAAFAAEPHAAAQFVARAAAAPAPTQPVYPAAAAVACVQDGAGDTRPFGKHLQHSRVATCSPEQHGRLCCRPLRHQPLLLALHLVLLSGAHAPLGALCFGCP